MYFTVTDHQFLGRSTGGSSAPAAAFERLKAAQAALVALCDVLILQINVSPWFTLHYQNARTAGLVSLGW